jgi:hypothetical protein
MSSLTRFLSHLSEDGENDENLSKNLLILREKKVQEQKQKAINYWKLLRNTIRKATQAAVESDIKDVNISHGMHHQRKINHQTNLKCVLFMKDKKVSSLAHVGKAVVNTKIASYKYVRLSMLIYNPIKLHSIFIITFLHY